LFKGANHMIQQSVLLIIFVTI